jgi:hypothetical protein
MQIREVLDAGLLSNRAIPRQKPAPGNISS